MLTKIYNSVCNFTFACHGQADLAGQADLECHLACSINLFQF